MFRSPHCADIDQLDADIAFVGMPFDQGTFGRPGARYGPDALRDAPRAYSYLDPYGHGQDAEGFFDADAGDELLRGITMADCGNVTVNPSDVVHNFERLAGVVARIAERGAMPVILGGDHAITFPSRGRPGPLRSLGHRALRCAPRLHPRLPGNHADPRQPNSPLP